MNQFCDGNSYKHWETSHKIGNAVENTFLCAFLWGLSKSNCCGKVSLHLFSLNFKLLKLSFPKQWLYHYKSLNFTFYVFGLCICFIFSAIAVCAGLLFGLITMLVQYVGLFMTGFHTGLAIAIGSIVAFDQFYEEPSLLATIGTLLGVGLLFAILNLHWQKGTYYCIYINCSIKGRAVAGG